MAALLGGAFETDLTVFFAVVCFFVFWAMALVADLALPVVLFGALAASDLSAVFFVCFLAGFASEDFIGDPELVFGLVDFLTGTFLLLVELFLTAADFFTFFFGVVLDACLVTEAGFAAFVFLMDFLTELFDFTDFLTDLEVFFDTLVFAFLRDKGLFDDADLTCSADLDDDVAFD